MKTNRVISNRRWLDNKFIEITNHYRKQEFNDDEIKSFLNVLAAGMDLACERILECDKDNLHALKLKSTLDRLSKEGKQP